MKTVKTACPLDCWDQCALLVKVKRGRIVAIGADPDQPATANLICSKGRAHLDRVNHPGRLRYPLLKRNGSFERIGWREALETAGEKIERALDKYGSLSLLHYHDAGHNGLLKNLESRFFSSLGGCTTHRGSLCWGAGIAAQKYDFGSVQAHPYQDLLNARLIIVWGRNPANTSVHLLSMIGKARQNGARVILIDPVQTATFSAADQYIRIKPGTDGALALALARAIIDYGFQDADFIAHYSSGFEQFAALCRGYTTEKAAGLTGIPTDVIDRLALDYAGCKPAAILIGIGLQRHSNGGNTVRAIDALAALCGNIGVPGGGANYANFRVTRYIDHRFLNGEDLNPRRRYYPKPQLARALLDFRDPPIEFLYISRSNPMLQVGDLQKLGRAFSSVPFVVTSEHFMTDTCAASDLVLPATCFLEEDDLYFNSMSHQYLSYGSQVVDPPGECRSEYDFLAELAGMLGVEGFPRGQAGDLINRAIKPLTEATGITVETVKKTGPLLLPGGDDVPWTDRIFETPDGKYNFYSEAAQLESGEALPCFREPAELSDRSLHEAGFSYWFHTPHPRDSIHSSHRLPDPEKAPQAYIHPSTAQREGVLEGRRIGIISKRGSIEAKASITDRVPPETVVIYEGWWRSSGAAVNNLTPDSLTDMGNQAAYYDCLCRIELLED